MRNHLSTALYCDNDYPMIIETNAIEYAKMVSCEGEKLNRFFAWRMLSIALC